MGPVCSSQSSNFVNQRNSPKVAMTSEAQQELRDCIEYIKVYNKKNEELKCLQAEFIAVKGQIESSLSKLFQIRQNDINRYISQEDINRFSIGPKGLEIDSDTFRDIILNTYTQNPNLTVCDLTVCNPEDTSYMLDLFKFVSATQIREIKLPRRLNIHEKIAQGRVDKQFIEEKRKKIKYS